MVLIAAIATMVTSLSACSFLSDLFNQFNGAANGQNNGRMSSFVPSSRPSIVDVSTPPADDLTANKASMIYHDYIGNSAYPISCTPSVGEAKLLIIPVWFNDSSKFIKEANKDRVKEDIEHCYFGTTEQVGWQSVKTYYEEESHGALTFTGTVSDWYSVDTSYTYYGSDPATRESGAPKTTALVESATDWYFTNHTDEKKTDYDCDGDGYLDGVMLIYAAPDYATLKNENYDNLWAFCFWVQDYQAQNPTNPGVNVFFWASYDFMYGTEYAISRTGYRYCAGDTTTCKLDTHTYIHEMGHMFGLEDYYDYSKNEYQPAGGFSMQDHNVGGHDPFSSFALGWGKAYIPTSDATIDLHPFVTTGEMILLTPSWNEYNSAFDEYLILEYYTSNGLNELDTTFPYMYSSRKTYPTGSLEYGIRLWHVDARLLYTASTSFSAKNVTTNAKTNLGRVTLMMSNTYPDGSDAADAYISPLGDSYGNYNILQLIRNKTNATYKPKDSLDSSCLFKKGDSFSMVNFYKQFVKGTKLNQNIDLGFTFEVNACNSTYASITIKKV